MISKFRIVILGIGGVGGYIGGKLAAYYADSHDVEVAFIARGENEQAIASNGLRLITSEGEQTVRPAIVTSRPDEIGAADLIICCVKSYDLEASMELLKPCVGDKTIILPLLNGIDAADRIKRILPGTEVWDGCMYIVSRLIAPGVVKESGNINVLYFGSAEDKEKLKQVESIFTSAHINAHVSDNIQQTLWEKFLFISPFATLTSYLNLSLGDILNNVQHEELLRNLMSEIKSIANAKNIHLPENIIEKNINKMKSFAPETTSSMHSDVQKGNRTEFNSLTAYVIELGKEVNVPTPNYDKIVRELKEKIRN